MPRFYVGHPQKHELSTDPQWHSFKTLDQQRFVWSIFIGLGIGLLAAVMWRAFYDQSLPLGLPSFTEIVVIISILTIGHEIIHSFGFPYFGIGSNTVFGLWPETCSPYVQHLSPMSRNRFLIALVLPFIILSIIPFLLAMCGIGSIQYLSWISVSNCIGVGSDMFIFSQIICAVPSQARVIESGDSLCWKK